MLGFERITFDPQVMGGRACIRGMRVTVSLVLNLVADGMTAEEIVEAYPYLEPEDVHETLRYAAWLAITRRNIPPELAEWLEPVAAAEKLSLNRTVIRLGEKEAGLRNRDTPEILHHDLDDLAGVWTQAEADELDEALALQRKIDPEVRE